METYLTIGLVAIPAKLRLVNADNPKNAETVEVVGFVDNSQIEAKKDTETYCLSPQDIGIKAFTLFYRAMKQAKVVALANFYFREGNNGQRKQLSATIFPAGNSEMAIQIEPSSLMDNPIHKLRPFVLDSELRLALTLIDQMMMK